MLRRRRWDRRSRATVLGLAALAAYVLGAWISGSLDPLARRPILDGAATLPYRWVTPPPALAGTNKPPYAARSTITFRGDGTDPAVITTNDQQAEVVLQLGAIPRVPGAESVTVTIRPLDPATFGAPPDHLSVLGNDYRFQATYSPSGAAVRTLRSAPQVFLMWPAVGVSARDRTLLYSPDGSSWTALKSQADHALLTATAKAPSLDGYFEVATSGQIPSSIRASSPAGLSAGPATGGVSGGSGAGGSILTWIVIAASLLVGAALVGLRLRARAREREYRSYQRYGEGDPSSATPSGPVESAPPSQEGGGGSGQGKGAHRRRGRPRHGRHG